MVLVIGQSGPRERRGEDGMDEGPDEAISRAAQGRSLARPGPQFFFFCFTCP